MAAAAVATHAATILLEEFEAMRKSQAKIMGPRNSAS